MPYEKTKWIDHFVDPETGEVIQEGTRVTAERMNKIENGIEAAHDEMESIGDNINGLQDEVIAHLADEVQHLTTGVQTINGEKTFVDHTKIIRKNLILQTNADHGISFMGMDGVITGYLVRIYSGSDNYISLSNLRSKPLRLFDNGHLLWGTDHIWHAGNLPVEEGTWTPSLTGATGTNNHTYTKRSGKYYKVGKKVFVSGSMALSEKDATMSGIVKIEGLPFVASGVSGGVIASIRYINLGAAAQFGLLIIGSTNYVLPTKINNSASDNNVIAADILNNSCIEFSAEYLTN